MPPTNRDAPRIGVYGQISELPPEVAAFVARLSGDELCLSSLWFDLLVRHGLAAGQQPRIYVVRAPDGGTIEGVMFAMSAVDGRRPRTLTSLSNFYTMSFAPLLSPEADARSALETLASHIAGERPAWDVVDLKGLIREATTTALLARAFQRAGMLVGDYFQFENWFFLTGGMSAADYFKSRPSQARNTITRKLKKAQKEHKLEFRLCASAADLAAGLADYERIYARSWKDPEAHPEFIPQLLRRFAEQQKLRLGILRIDGEPAAAQIWLVTGKRATIYKLAYDEKFAPLSVGSILTKMMFDHVLDSDKVAEIDYGVGSEAYKLDWMNECRHVVGLVCFNPLSLNGLVAAGRHFGGHLRRRWIEVVKRITRPRVKHPAGVIKPA